jgi:sugar phosphate isomerase/epimerase
MKRPDLAPATMETKQPRWEVISRRSFLGTAGGAMATLALGSAYAAQAASRGRIAAAAETTCTGTVTRDKLGFQLYTTAALYLTDMPECLALLSSIGYTSVERFGGYGGLVDPSGASVSATPQQFKKALDDTGLWCSGGHDNGLWPYDETTFKQTVEGALIVGQPYIGCNPTFPTTVPGCMQFVQAAYKEHEIARSMGFPGPLYAHFDLPASLHPLTDDPSRNALNVIVENTTRDVWNPELDTEHALQMLHSINAVLALVRKYPGRFFLLHMKDGTTPVGGVEASGVSTEFGMGDWASADPSDPKGRPHARFQDLLTVVNETENWKDVLLIGEMDGSPTGLDYANGYYSGMNGLKFLYACAATQSGTGTHPTPRKHRGKKHHKHRTHKHRHEKHRQPSRPVDHDGEED